MSFKSSGQFSTMIHLDRLFKKFPKNPVLWSLSLSASSWPSWCRCWSRPRTALTSRRRSAPGQGRTRERSPSRSSRSGVTRLPRNLDYHHRHHHQGSILNTERSKLLWIGNLLLELYNWVDFWPYIPCCIDIPAGKILNPQVLNCC